MRTFNGTQLRICRIEITHYILHILRHHLAQGALYLYNISAMRTFRYEYAATKFVELKLRTTHYTLNVSASSFSVRVLYNISVRCCHKTDRISGERLPRSSTVLLFRYSNVPKRHADFGIDPHKRTERPL